MPDAVTVEPVNTSEQCRSAMTAIARPGRNGGTLYPFQRGEKANLKGRPKAGLVKAEYLNLMAEWSKEEIQAVADDEKAPIAQRQAAIHWLHSISLDRDAGGRPINLAASDHIDDRTVGRPDAVITQQIDLTSGDTLTLDRQALDRLPPSQIQIIATLMDLLRRAVSGETVTIPTIATTPTANAASLPEIIDQATAPAPAPSRDEQQQQPTT